MIEVVAAGLGTTAIAGHEQAIAMMTGRRGPSEREEPRDESRRSLFKEFIDTLEIDDLGAGDSRPGTASQLYGCGNLS